MKIQARIVTWLLASLPLGGSAAGSEDSFVLKGATVVVGDGRVVEHASVLVREGHIVAVGTRVPTPAGTRVVDLTGRYVYPGLIDALSEQGLEPDAEPTPAKAGAAAPRPDHTGPDGGGFFAHVEAARLVAQDPGRLAAWRDAGVLALHVAPAVGIFTGQTAVVSTAAEGEPPRVVRAPVAMRVVLRTLSAPRRLGLPVPGGNFPGALLTVWAHLRQTVLDARHREEAMALPPEERQAFRWPESDRTLLGLAAVARGRMPLVIPASAEREVQRVVDFADEVGVRCVVAGGYEAAARARSLIERKIPVLVSLNFPRKKAPALGQVREFMETAGVPEPEETLRAMQFRRHAPASPAELSRAGVSFAFYSDGLKTGADFVAGLRTAVAHGLPRAAALHAATLSAARILGVDRELGSVEPGKLANLLVTDRDLFDDQARVTLLVVRGREVAPGPSAVAATRAPAAPAGSAAAVETEPPSLAPRELLIRHTTVMTVTRGTLADTSILVRDGRIAALGRDLQAGPGALVVDASGQWVTPGFIDTHAHIATDAHNDATVAVTSMARVKDVLDPTDVDIYRVLAGGVTTSNLLHGSVNPIGGQSAVIKMRWGRPARELLFEGALPSLKLALGTNPKSRGTDPAPGVDRRYPASRMGVADVIRTAFQDARRYREAWADYARLKAAGRAPALPPRRDLRLEPLAEVLDGKRILHVHCYGADEMLTLARLGDELGFKPNVLHHAAEAYKIAPEIAARGLAVAGFDLLATKIESWDGIPRNAEILTRHGVSYSIGADDAAAAAHMNVEAAKLMDDGLSADEALAAITINAARQLGIDSRVGSIEVGKDADLVVFPRQPLSVYARPEMVFIDGRLYFSRERDRQRQQALLLEKRRLSELDEAERKAQATPAARAEVPAEEAR